MLAGMEQDTCLDLPCCRFDFSCKFSRAAIPSVRQSLASSRSTKGRYGVPGDPRGAIDMASSDVAVSPSFGELDYRPEKGIAEDPAAVKEDVAPRTKAIEEAEEVRMSEKEGEQSPKNDEASPKEELPTSEKIEGSSSVQETPAHEDPPPES
ncbi:uncharacterized protein G2W53_041051 [Senna tora]|uniref:Uncharacterized protein n=1 Tax=Senna tora TaxID=362788 RepID=A0A834SD66_9FABA|nr:uncharacterized protein G2W53_041051 [Senna tora]